MELNDLWLTKHKVFAPVARYTDSNLRTIVDNMRFKEIVSVRAIYPELNARGSHAARWCVASNDCRSAACSP
jgi:RNA polymerase-interacting CarD/CdnL/TRCF family regulator